MVPVAVGGLLPIVCGKFFSALCYVLLGCLFSPRPSIISLNSFKSIVSDA